MEKKTTFEFTPAEELAFVQRLMNDAEFAADYFFNDAAFGARCKTAAKIVNRTYIDFHDCTEMEIRAILYMYFCHNPGKNPLATFKAEVPFQAWLWGTRKGVAMRYVFRYYDSLRFVRPRLLSSGNTKLRILHLPEARRQYIVDLVAVPDFHELLVKFYVEKKEPEVICSELKYNMVEFKAGLSAAKSTLRQMIIETEDKELIEEALWTSILPFKVDVDDLVIPEIADEESSRTQVFRQAMKDVFGLDHKHPLYLANLEEFIRKVAQEAKPEDTKSENWERDAEIWLARFLDGVPAKELAVQYKMQSTNVDNIKSKFEKKIIAYLKKKIRVYLKEA